MDATMTGTPSHLAERFDHDGTFRHHHDSITRDPIWWEYAEQFGGEKREHRHEARPAARGTAPLPPWHAGTRPEECPVCARLYRDHLVALQIYSDARSGHQTQSPYVDRSARMDRMLSIALAIAFVVILAIAVGSAARFF